MKNTRFTWILAVLCLLLAVAAVVAPLYIIRPFVPQNASALSFALRTRAMAPFLTAGCVVAVLVALAWAWGRLRVASRVGLTLILLVTAACAAATRVDVFEHMFKPYPQPQFTSAAKAKVDGDDAVLAFAHGGEAKAYPVRAMGYHHIVNDTVGGEPVAITYCTLCHTGLAWSRRLQGEVLTFRLAGINNGNALLRDEQTNSVWQQSTGEAIYGPHKGERLTNLGAEELRFATWRSEHPEGKVLAPNPAYEAEYDPKDWERRITRHPVVVDVSRSGLPPYTLMLGVESDGEARAYPVKTVLDAGIVQDHWAKGDLLLVTEADRASVRVFRPVVDGGEPLTFVRSGTRDAALLTDAESASTWSFQGCAVSGKYAGRCLTPVEAHKTFWFDWLQHHPETSRLQ